MFNALGPAAGATPGAPPFFDCAGHTTGAASRWCRDFHTIREAWFVYPRYGSYQLHNGAYRNASQPLSIVLLERPGLFVIDRDRAAALTLVTRADKGGAIYLSLFSRRGPWFLNDATQYLGAVRPLHLTLRGDRLRVSFVDRSGRQAIVIYHISGRRLNVAATRHAQ